jgi:transcriptional regulator with XRE-family HTH domain
VDQAPPRIGDRPLSERAAFHRAAFAERLKDARKVEGISQEALAERVGCDRRTIMRIERRKVPVTLELVEALADALGMEPEDFLGSLTTSPMDAQTFRLKMDDVFTDFYERTINQTAAGLSRKVVKDLFLPLANLPDHELAFVTVLLNSRVRDLYDPKPSPDGTLTFNKANTPPLHPRVRRE